MEKRYAKSEKVREFISDLEESHRFEKGLLKHLRGYPLHFVPSHTSKHTHKHNFCDLNS